MTPSVRRLERVGGEEAAFDDLARLRIEISGDFPYLYEGDLDYERRYSRDLSDVGRRRHCRCLRRRGSGWRGPDHASPLSGKPFLNDFAKPSPSAASTSRTSTISG